MTDRDNVGWATVTLIDGMQMVGKSGSGHGIVLDGAPGLGRNTGIRPMKLLLLSLADCTGMDVAHILSKRRVNVQHFQVQVNARQAPTHPRVYTDIEVKGPDIKVNDLEMAIELSATAFCPVSAMLGGAARITHKLPGWRRRRVCRNT